MDQHTARHGGAREFCPHFGRCGGCQALDRPYDEQLREKKRRLEEAFEFAGFKEVPDLLPSPQVYRYRHKVQLPFGAGKHGKSPLVTLGCYAKDSHKVVDQHACLIQDEELSRIAWGIRSWAQAAGLTVYDEKKRSGFLRHVLLRKGAGTGEILIGLVTNGGRPVGLKRLAAGILEASRKALAGSASSVAGVVQNVNTRCTNVVLGEQEFAWWGRPFIFEKLGPYRFKVGLQTFFQVNPFQTAGLYDEVLRHIENGPAVIDCFCGVGSLSLWVARKSRVVLGIEENAASVAAAGRAAGANGARNVRFVKGDAAAELPVLMQGFETAVFDPPRKGLGPEITGTLLGPSSLTRIICVSCDPGTLARDVRALLPAWRPVSLQGVDMFPHTGHLESVAVLDKR
ncbi:MAG: 23S rRNA (uracil(1939)-C(5))-methyltransferase RlmD [Chitinispirillaceae bacterium]|nr:23S rRNA (uracil(1939)-C(5))-methyltransferase RlmD [Chitinispirillaceae bacterium]